MTTDLNARLAAIIEKHPSLRPIDDGWQLTFADDDFHWRREEHGEVSFSTARNTDARALIFRTMVESLPAPCALGRSIAGKWGCTEGDFTIAEHQTAMDALIAFWEARETRGGEGEKR